MAKLIWTKLARADLRAIGAHFAQASPAFAAVLVRRLAGAVTHLAQFPNAGRLVPEAPGSDLREVLHRNYRIVYLYAPEEDQVDILTVFHASRQFGAPPTDEG